MKKIYINVHIKNPNNFIFCANKISSNSKTELWVLLIDIYDKQNYKKCMPCLIDKLFSITVPF